MDKTEITALIAYNFWANKRILDRCEQVALEDLIRPLVPDPGRGSLRGILVHALDAEMGWRSILQFHEDTPILDERNFGDIAALKARWDAEQNAWFEYAAALRPEDLNTSYKAGPGKSPKVWQIIVHVVNHGTQHRSEAAAILTGYGLSPGELDLDLFLQENPDYC